MNQEALEYARQALASPFISREMIELRLNARFGLSWAEARRVRRQAERIS